METMSTSTIDYDLSLSAAPMLMPQRVRQTPFFLASQGEPLFAWLHTTPHDAGLDHGVLICPPIGFEQLHAHRGLRHLADALAGLGLPVLRFDWHGTGDSAGSDADLARCATWVANARDAEAWLRNEFGCRRVSVVGLRMGALIAAQAFSDRDIDRFVLWSPVISGRSYTRQMQVIDLTAEVSSSTAGQPTGDIEAAGFLLTRETIGDLSRWNLLQSELKCRRALIVASDDAPADDRLRARCEAQGIAAEQVMLPGVAQMLIEPHHGQVPQIAIDAITNWLGKQICVEAAPRPAVKPAALATDCSDGRLRERTFQISEPKLFGIISEPEVPNECLPTIVLLNSGSAYRIGASRLNLVLARELAALGFRCLRLDLGGLGDSVAADCDDENNPYSAAAFRDIESTLEQLKRRLGVERCVLLGLCSGAYTAFQAAVQLSDPALVESILINPLTFFWKDGMSLDMPSIEQVLKHHRCMARALEPKKLIKFFTGRTQVGFREAARIIARRLMHTIPRPQAAKHEPPAASLAIGLGHPTKDDLPADLARVAANGRMLAMFFAKTDPGYSILTYRARRQAKRMRQAGRLHLSFIADADHTFSRRRARQELVQAVGDYLRQRYSGIGAVRVRRWEAEAPAEPAVRRR
jgi:pimeloyl-ACP methyl ester carboxylesterase